MSDDIEQLAQLLERSVFFQQKGFPIFDSEEEMNAWAEATEQDLGPSEAQARWLLSKGVSVGREQAGGDENENEIVQQRHAVHDAANDASRWAEGTVASPASVSCVPTCPVRTVASELRDLLQAGKGRPGEYEATLAKLDGLLYYAAPSHEWGDPGRCGVCGAPFQWVRPGKSQARCDCWSICPKHGRGAIAHHAEGEFHQISGYFCAQCERAAERGVPPPEGE